LWERGDSGREGHILGFVKVDAGVRRQAVIVQGSDKNSAIRKNETDVGVVSKGTSNKHPPGEADALEASAKGDQQRFESQVEQQGSKGVTLANPTSNRYRSNRMAIVQEKSGSVGIGCGKGMLEKGRKTVFSKNGRKVRVADPVVSLFLIKEDKSAVDRVFGGMTQDVANGHSDISCVAMLDKTSLMRRDKGRHDRSKARGKHPGKDLDITVGEGDRTPVSDVG
jgi:hypothetical protein